MAKYHSYTIRILSIITFAAFILTQAGPSYALRSEQANASGVDMQIANALGGEQTATANMAGQPRQEWSEERVISEIRRLYNEGVDLSDSFVGRVNSPLRNAARRNFVTWKAAVIAAGFNYDETRKNQDWSEGKVISEIQRLHSEGADLGGRFVSRTNSPLYNAARRNFVTWKAAIIAAGLDYDKTKKYQDWPEGKVISEIQRLHSEGVDLSDRAINKANPSLYGAAFRLFGSWKGAVTKAGLDYDEIRKYQDWSREKVISEIQRLHNEGADLGSGVIQEANQPLYSAACYYFNDSWEEAIIAAGLNYDEIRKRKDWSEEKVISEIQRLHGEGVDLALEAIKKSNSSLLKNAIKYFDSWFLAVMKAGINYYEEVIKSKNWTKLRSQLPGRNISIPHPAKFKASDRATVNNRLRAGAIILGELIKLRNTQGDNALTESVQQQALEETTRLVTNGRARPSRIVNLTLGLEGPRRAYTLRELQALPVRFLNPRIPQDKSQEMAVRLALAEDNELTLIHGPAGTGKTAVIAEISRQFARQGKRVLITTFTNEALDNALDNIVTIEEALPVGRAASRQEAITKEQLRPRIVRTPDQLADFERRSARENGGGFILGATHIGLETVWALREAENDFDVVIIDEASQSNMPSMLVALLKAKREGAKVIIVGDHKQLPPFGISDEDLKALSQQLDPESRKRLPTWTRSVFNTSLFDTLIQQRVFGRVMLTTDYRHHWAIARIISELFYENSLASNRLDEPLAVDTFKVIDTSLEPQHANERSGNSFINRKEAELAVNEVNRLMSEGLKPEEIGIVSFYSAQVDYIRSLLGEDLASRIQVSTVDSFQGREKKAVILSATRSNPENNVGFLNDRRRLNVALSRAMDKLIIIGDFATLSTESRDNKVAGIFSRIHEYAGELRDVMATQTAGVVASANGETIANMAGDDFQEDKELARALSRAMQLIGKSTREDAILVERIIKSIRRRLHSTNGLWTRRKIDNFEQSLNECNRLAYLIKERRALSVLVDLWFAIFEQFKLQKKMLPFSPGKAMDLIIRAALRSETASRGRDFSEIMQLAALLSKVFYSIEIRYPRASKIIDELFEDKIQAVEQRGVKIRDAIDKELFGMSDELMDETFIFWHLLNMQNGVIAVPPLSYDILKDIIIVQHPGFELTISANRIKGRETVLITEQGDFSAGMYINARYNLLESSGHTHPGKAGDVNPSPPDEKSARYRAGKGIPSFILALRDDGELNMNIFENGKWTLMEGDSNVKPALIRLGVVSAAASGSIVASAAGEAATSSVLLITDNPLSPKVLELIKEYNQPNRQIEIVNISPYGSMEDIYEITNTMGRHTFDHVATYLTSQTNIESILGYFKGIGIKVVPITEEKGIEDLLNSV